jgi:hypothetical protein
MGIDPEGHTPSRSGGFSKSSTPATQTSTMTVAPLASVRVWIVPLTSLET